mmetsp:Transcript_79788/g.221970  ORF Transcript_79788/g.221970 Transcript_79788/m.221970 type:complete len:291 (-) Transcript_79788:90-962(-)
MGIFMPTIATFAPMVVSFSWWNRNKCPLLALALISTAMSITVGVSLMEPMKEVYAPVVDSPADMVNTGTGYKNRDAAEISVVVFSGGVRLDMANMVDVRNTNTDTTYCVVPIMPSGPAHEVLAWTMCAVTSTDALSCRDLVAGATPVDMYDAPSVSDPIEGQARWRHKSWSIDCFRDVLAKAEEWDDFVNLPTLRFPVTDVYWGDVLDKAEALLNRTSARALNFLASSPGGDVESSDRRVLLYIDAHMSEEPLEVVLWMCVGSVLLLLLYSAPWVKIGKPIYNYCDCDSD